MAKFAAKIGVMNEEERPRVVWVEPWADDFTLLARETLEIRATCDGAELSFTIVETERNTQVYIEVASAYLDSVTFEVFQGPQRLATGHNRRAALDSGITM